MRALCVCAYMREVGACRIKMHSHRAHRPEDLVLGGTFACVPFVFCAFGGCSTEMHLHSANRPPGPHLGGTCACVLCVFAHVCVKLVPAEPTCIPSAPIDHQVQGCTFACVPCMFANMRQVGACSTEMHPHRVLRDSGGAIACVRAPCICARLGPASTTKRSLA